MTRLYCPTCRCHFVTEDEACPPYSAVHILTDPVTHVHPITRNLLTAEEG